MKKLKILKKSVISLVFAAALTGIFQSEIMDIPVNSVSDTFYQRPSTPVSDIVLIGIDDRALAEFGPWPWTRDIMAMAIETLNQDPNIRPAVIGIDAVFSGYSAYPEFDEYLADVVTANDNIVMASFADFGTDIVTNDSDENSFYVDDFSILAYTEPFPEISDYADVAHVNAMLDTDGILRHALWEFTLPTGEVVPSFHQSIYKKYMAFLGEEPLEKPPTDARERWYVPLQSTPFSYDDGYSVMDLVYGEIDPEVYRDKIVLIGPYSVGLQDAYRTSIEHAELMHGVEFQANAIGALLLEDMKFEVLKTSQIVFVFFITFISFMWFYDRKILHATIGVVVALVSYIALCLWLFEIGYVVHVMYVPVSLMVSYVLSVGINYVTATNEKRAITNTFRRYVAPQIVTELLADDKENLELGGKLTDIAVLFVDIRGFTTMSEDLEAPVVVDILNKYLQLTSECILNNNGTLDKYIGDCTMAFWGAPIKQDDIIFKAVKAALDMVEGSKELSAELKEKYGVSINFGIGVNYGPAVVGNIGSKTRMDYTAIGNTVNTSARLESTAKNGEILVSKNIADALSDRIGFESLGNIALKGKNEEFEVFRVIC